MPDGDREPTGDSREECDATKALRLEQDGAVATIVLDRPDRLNAMTRTMARDFVALLDRLDRDDSVRAVILTGAGRAFCAGADLSPGTSALSGGAKADAPFDWSDPQFRDFGGVITLRLFEMLKPVIVAFNGSAAGVGVTMTLAADFRISSEDAKFAFPFTRRGIVPESASSWFLPRLVGIARALDWTLRGATITASEALSAGLVGRVLPAQHVLSAAQQLAAEIAEHTSPVSVALTRRMLWQGLTADHPALAHRVESEGLYWQSRSADVREGVASFLEKRPPCFTDTVSAHLPDLTWFMPAG
ncbi:MAG: enoyl-CoA hydratase-related protein [Novosphingobium sp.]